MNFTDENVDLAIEHLKTVAMLSGQTPIKYSQCFYEADLPLPDLIYEQDPGFAFRFMEAILQKCKELGLPPLDALVVQKDTGKPGKGYFTAWEVTKQGVDPDVFWAKQMQECWDWGKEERRKLKGK